MELDDSEAGGNSDTTVTLLFELVAENLGWASMALLENDVERASMVVESDRPFDQRCDRVIAAIKEQLGERTFDPDELEDLVATLQIIPELERSADLTVHIATRASQGLGRVIPPLSRGLIQSISDQAVAMWRTVGEAYAAHSRDARGRLEDADRELDELCASLASEGLADIERPKVAADLALVARFYERLGDHAVNLGRRIEVLSAPRRLDLSPTAFPAPRPDVPHQHSNPLRRTLSRLRRIRLVPTDNRFFDLFDASAANVQDCSHELIKVTSSFSDLDERFDRIKSFERRGDQLTRELLRLLDVSFITPFDREDIHALVEEIDDVVDAMFEAASLIQLVQVEADLPEVPRQAEILDRMTEEMVALISSLRSKVGTRYRLEQIEQLEHEGDTIHRQAIARLFSGDYSALEVLKWKDIVQALENAVNAVEDVSDVVESIVVKES